MIAVGDLHDMGKTLRNKIIEKDIENYNIIQVGDFGIGFGKLDNDIKELDSLNSLLMLRNLNMYIIKGNHDSPLFFNGDYMYKFSNLHLVPDYTVLQIEEQKILFVGGAISIDRKDRIKEMSKGVSDCYWEDEVFVLNEKNLNNIYGIDMVVTHSAPDYCFPDNRYSKMSNIVLNYVKNDYSLLNDLKREREDITKMFKILEKNGNNIKKHIYGHFHQSEITLNLYTTHYCLGINELREV